MITYSGGIDFMRLRGSVIPAAMKWAVPCSMLCPLYMVIFKYMSDAWTAGEPSSAEKSAWGLFMSVLGFLIIFRAQLGYSRYWEGIALVEQARGAWTNAASNMVAFCTSKPEKQQEVENFQNFLMRLLSMLFSVSLAEISNIKGTGNFEMLDVSGLDEDSMEYLGTKAGKREVLLQWIQKIIVDSQKQGVVDVAPPILSRVFQELGTGSIHFYNAKKLTDVPFPFPFAQTVFLMAVFFSTVPVPLICGVYTGSVLKGIIYAFMCIMAFWSIHYIAVELEMPFGDQYNDLPLVEISKRFNASLSTLLEAEAQKAPTYTHVRQPMRTSVCVQMKGMPNNPGSLANWKLMVDQDPAVAQKRKSEVKTADLKLRDEPALPGAVPPGAVPQPEKETARPLPTATAPKLEMSVGSDSEIAKLRALIENHESRLADLERERTQAQAPMEMRSMLDAFATRLEHKIDVRPPVLTAPHFSHATVLEGMDARELEEHILELDPKTSHTAARNIASRMACSPSPLETRLESSALS